MKLTLKVDHTPDLYGQRKHRVMMNNDTCIGTLYDNRDCHTQEVTYSFLPHADRVAGKFLPYGTSLRECYLSHARGVEGDDLQVVTQAIRCWAEDVVAWHTEARAQLQAALDSAPQLEYELSETAKAHAGMNCQVLGPCGSFVTFLDWASMAKIHGCGFHEAGQWQITDQGFGVRNHGYKWYYLRGSNVIHVGGYGHGTPVITINRSAGHIQQDARR